MLIAGVIALCVIVFLVALLWPRGSRAVERGGTAPLGAGQRAAGKAPGPLGRWFQKPFSKSKRAVYKSGDAGRRGHWKLRD